ncbi:hypothetical protein HAX54_006030 [Datura stramonium]|uniref:Uncharacterized protein n=1 Tax=Datura stramonium TaxID=4076 RepID=A0ABS8RUW5_DATST|nr:hypothetical protein [Datura stramonium]
MKLVGLFGFGECLASRRNSVMVRKVKVPGWRGEVKSGGGGEEGKGQRIVGGEKGRGRSSGCGCSPVDSGGGLADDGVFGSAVYSCYGGGWLVVLGLLVGGEEKEEGGERFGGGHI